MDDIPAEKRTEDEKKTAIWFRRQDVDGKKRTIIQVDIINLISQTPIDQKEIKVKQDKVDESTQDSEHDPFSFCYHMVSNFVNSDPELQEKYKVQP